MFQQKTCDICYCQWFSTAQENNLRLKKDSVSELLPGSENCLTLNTLLRVYFITTKLLKLPQEEFIEMIRTWHSPTKSIVPPSRPGPSTSKKIPTIEEESESKIAYSTLCSRCECIVNEAVETHGRVVELQGKIDKLGKVLSEIKGIADRAHGIKKPLPELVNRYDKSPVKLTTEHDDTSKQMLGLSMACLANLTFPKREVAPRQLRSSKKPKPLSKKKGNATVYTSPVEVKVEPEDKEKDHTFAVDTHFYDEGDGDFEPMDHEDTFDGIDIVNDNDEETEELADVGNVEPRDIPGNNDSDDDYDPEGEDDKSESCSDVEDDDSDWDKNLESDGGSTDSEVEEEVEVLDKDGNILAPFYTDNSLEKFQCTECPRAFPLRKLLQFHTKRIHGFDILYECHKCPDLKFTGKSLKDHQNHVHGHTCDKCEKKLSCRVALFRHLEVFHKMKLNYTCPLCKKAFHKRSQLRSHRNKEHTESDKSMFWRLPPREPETREEEEWSKIPCEDCGKIYLSGEKLDKHLLYTHEKNIGKDERISERVRCYFCWKYFHHKQRLSIHIKMAHSEFSKGLAFPCDLCSDSDETQIIFSSFSELRDHFKTIHEGSDIHQCEKCEWPFLDVESLKTHEKCHVRVCQTGETKRAKRQNYKFKCWFCWEVYQNEEDRQHHARTARRHRKRTKVEFTCDVLECHHNIHPFETIEQLNEHCKVAHVDIHNGNTLDCEECSWSCVSKDALTIHKLNHVPRIKSHFACPSCGHSSIQLVALKNHYNTHHGLNMKLFKCKFCNLGCKSSGSLRRHLLYNHKQQAEEENPSILSSKIPCEQCGKFYKNEVVLKKHQFYVHQDHQCPDCGEIFHKFTKFNNHVIRVHGHGEQHLCPLCGKTFLSKRAVHLHMQHHGHGVKKYQCHVCRIRMADLDKMKEHIKRIHESKPQKKDGKFPCEECGKGFARKDTLDDHVRVHHTPETRRVWSCEICEMRFTRKGYLEQHLKGGTRGCTGLPKSEVIII